MMYLSRRRRREKRGRVSGVSFTTFPTSSSRLPLRRRIRLLQTFESWEPDIRALTRPAPAATTVVSILLDSCLHHRNRPAAASAVSIGTSTTDNIGTSLGTSPPNATRAKQTS